MRLRICVIVIWGILSTAAKAADFTIIDSEGQTGNLKTTELLMTGPIVEGDKDKLEKFLASPVGTRWKPKFREARIRMRSNGGSLAAGIELGEYIYELGFKTYVGQNDSCLSACAIAFMFGVEPDGDDTREISRTIHHTAELGFHAPYAFAKSKKIPDKIRQALLPDAERGARQAGADLVRLNVTGRLPSDLIQQLLLVEQEDFLLVDTVDRAGRWDISLESAKPLFELNHKRLEAYCSNIFAWQSSVSFNNRTDRHDVKLLSIDSGNSLVTAMMEFDCELSLGSKFGFSKPIVFEVGKGFVSAWQALPANVLLKTLGPEEITGAAGPKWDQRFPRTSSSGQIDYDLIKEVSGSCRDGLVWIGGWYGRDGSNDHKDLLYSHATVASCGGGFGPMSIDCKSNEDTLKLRFAYGAKQRPNSDGRVALDLDGVNYNLIGVNGDVYGHEQIYVDLPKRHPLLDALKSGNLLELIGDGPNQKIHLNGSRKVIEAMELACE